MNRCPLRHFIFIILLYDSREDCVLIKNSLQCKNVDQKEFNFEYNSKITQENNVEVIKVVDSDLEVLEKLGGGGSLIEVGINNCGLNRVSNGVFDGLTGLKIVDFSNNKIEDVEFLKYLPESVQIVKLSNNSLTEINFIFDNLINLRIIDLSRNKLTKIDFTIFKNNPHLELINVSNNNIEESTSKEYLKNIKCVDLSYNDLNKYDNVPSYCLDFSHTNSNGYQWYNVSEKNSTVQVEKFFFTDNNKLKMSATNVKGDIINIDIKYLNVSRFKSDTSGLNLTKVKVRNEFLLKDSHVNVLDKTVYNFKGLFYDDGTNATFDLSNCSIKDISSKYFQDYNLGKLDLCYNKFKEVKSGTFQDSYIIEINLCNGNIEYIQDDAFQNVHNKMLNLTRNKLVGINFLQNVKGMEVLDLSYNLLKTFNSNSIPDGLRLLDLRYNLLETIPSEAFGSLKSLTDLNLNGNPIFLIDTNAFTNLPNLVYINLSDMKLKTLQPYTFNNLENLQELYLTNNGIVRVPNNVFVSSPNLNYIDLNKNPLINFGANNIDLKVLKICPEDKFQWENLQSPTLKSLYISGANLNTLTLPGLENLRYLKLEGTNVAYISSNTLSGLYNLRYLDEQNLFKQTSIIKTDTFKDLRLITNLNLANLSIRIIEPGAFTGLVSLEKLNLRNNQLQELRKCTFCNLNNLWYLDLSKNELSRIYPGALDGLNHLIELKLHNNKLVQLPNNLPDNLIVFDVSNNYINNVCGGFDGLIRLKVLDMGNNVIENVGCQGFPSGIEHLNLEGNRLVQIGTVEVLKALPLLNYVNLNDNNQFVNNNGSLKVYL